MRSPHTAAHPGPARPPVNGTRPDLFVYGTLLFDEVLVALLERVPDRRPATLRGWRAAALPGRLYPGLVADPDATTDGLVLLELTDQEWAVLDAFEGDAYELRPVPVAGHDHVVAYVYRDAARTLPNAWDRDAFAARHLRRYARRCGG